MRAHAVNAVLGVLVAAALLLSLRWGLARLRGPPPAAGDSDDVAAAADSAADFDGGDDWEPRPALAYEASEGGALWVLPRDDEAAWAGWVVVLHGCGNSAWAWLQLPEHERVTRALLARGLAVLAVSSRDAAGSGCWLNIPTAAANADVQRVRAAMDDFARAHATRVDGRPVFLLGVSSGGTFATILARALPTPPAGVAVYVSPGSSVAMAARGAFPPTVFVHMARDEQWATPDVVAEAAARLRAGGTARVLTIVVLPRPATVADASSRLNVPPGDAARLVDELRTAGLLSSRGTDGGEVARDPREAQDVVAAAVTAVGRTLRGRERQVAEYLNACYAVHEMTSEHVQGVLEFFLPK